MRTLLLALALLALTACAATPPEDGVARVQVDGRWVIQGHNHADAVLHFDRCEGCARLFRGAWRDELGQLQQDLQAAQAARAQTAPVSSPTGGAQ